MASYPLTTVGQQRTLGRVETHLRMASELLGDTGGLLERIGHTDSAQEIAAIMKQLRRLRVITESRLTD